MTTTSNDPIEQPIEIVRGTTFNPNITVTTTDAFNVTTPVNIFGGLLIFMVKKSRLQQDILSLLTYDSDGIGGITIVNAVLGQAKLLIQASDTLDTFKFPEGKNLDYALKLILGSTSETIIAQGSFTVVSRAVLQT